MPFLQTLLILMISTVSLSETNEKFVNLSLKQGLIMNQILSIYSLDKFQTELCKNHTLELRNGLRQFQPWALKMFDASSKLQSGVLLGNLVEFGSFKQCLQIHRNSDFGPISGKYCLIKITPTIGLIRKILEFRNISAKRFSKVHLIVERSAIFWSICIPHSCELNEISEHFNRNFQDLSQGLNLTISIKEKHCVTEKEYPNFGLVQYLVLTVLGTFVVIVAITTIIDLKLNRPKNRIIDSFSAVSNYKRIISRRDTDLDCLHGLRFLSTCYVVIGHRYLMAMFFPVVNSLEILDWILEYSSTIIIGGTICVDSFFMISGLLVSYGYFELVTKTGRFNLLLFYLHRYLRITPPLGIVVLIYTTLVQFFGSGPLWAETMAFQQEPCQKFWWSILLHIQGFVNPHSLCIIQTWYLSCEMPYYYFSPIILYPLWKYPVFGYMNYIVFYILSLGINFYLAWINRYEGGMPITNQLFETKYFQHHYIAPHTRASPYLIGLGLGFALFKIRGRKIEMSWFTSISCWIVGLFSMVAAVIGCHSFQLENHPYNRWESSLFLSCSRSAWCLGLAWMVWSCVTGHGGYVDYFLRLHMFRVLGRVSYGVFLLHMLLQFSKSGATKIPIYFSNFSAIYDSFADLLIMLFVGFAFTIFFELPLINIENLLFNMKRTKGKIDPNK